MSILTGQFLTLLLVKYFKNNSYVEPGFETQVPNSRVYFLNQIALLMMKKDKAKKIPYPMFVSIRDAQLLSH